MKLVHKQKNDTDAINNNKKHQQTSSSAKFFLLRSPDVSSW